MKSPDYINEPPPACNICGRNEFDEKIVDMIDNTVCEKKIICHYCGNLVGYWAYGFYDNDFDSYKIK